MVLRDILSLLSQQREREACRRLRMSFPNYYGLTSCDPVALLSRGLVGNVRSPAAAGMGYPSGHSHR